MDSQKIDRREWVMAMEQQQIDLGVTFMMLDVKKCSNPDCTVPLSYMPVSFFSSCRMNGRIYRRSWCKFCEAARERKRHKEVVKLRQTVEDSQTTTVSLMMRKYFWRA